MADVERALKQDLARLTIVETSQIGDFQVGGSFYEDSGFVLEAEIRIFWMQETTS